jgi:hypothetical protein
MTVLIVGGVVLGIALATFVATRLARLFAFLRRLGR